MATSAQVNKFASIPTYARITEDLRARVQSGEWPDGGMLPSRKDLASAYGVDINTLQRAIAPLLRNGMLRADGGRGTFLVSTPSSTSRSSRGHGERALPHSTRPITAGIIWKTDRETDCSFSPNLWAPVVSAIERTASATRGMTRQVDLGRPESADLTLAKAVDLLLDRGVDGIISVVDAPPDQMNTLFDIRASVPIPIVHAGGTLSRAYGLSVYFDSVDAGYHAASHLISQGCRDILFFAGYTSVWVRQRAQGAREAAHVCGLDADAFRTAIADTDLYPMLSEHHVNILQEHLAYEEAKKMLKSGLPAQGIAAANDFNAHGFIRAANEAGYRIGADYAIVGFDDFPPSRQLGLTTLRPPLEAIGREAVAMLGRAIDEPTLTMRTCLPSELIVRESTVLTATAKCQAQTFSKEEQK